MNSDRVTDVTDHTYKILDGDGRTFAQVKAKRLGDDSLAVDAA